MKITAIRTSTSAVGEYRIRHPMLALRDQGHNTRVITLDQSGEARVSNLELAGDILVLGRVTSTTVFDLLETLPGKMRPKVVYEIDDDPWEWHPWDWVHATLGARYARDVTTVMGRCDAVTCSTRTLAARIQAKFPAMPIWVVPNAIDYQLRDWTAREDRKELGLEGRTVLGWTGSIHHARDGEPMLQALPEILSQYPETVFLMQCDRSVWDSWTSGLRQWVDKKRLAWSPPVPFEVHCRAYSLFDVNLAPLEMTKFNVCKSDLRLIEGGAHGVPYVASNIAAYTEFHEHTGGIGGYLASTPGEWVDGMEMLIEGEREARGQSLQRHVRETRGLSIVAGQWQAAFSSILEGGRGTIETTAINPRRNSPCPCGSGRKYKRCHAPAYG